MQLPKLINPKQIFGKKKKKDRSVSRYDQSSLSWGTTSSSEDSTTSTASHKTPKSVLRADHSWLPSSSSYDKFDLLQAFKLIDRDNDGLIPKSELAAVLSRLGAEPLSNDEIATMLMEFVVDDDGGFVSLEALVSRLGSDWEPAAGDEGLRETFDFFDTDQDGKITAEELFKVFKEAIGDERCTLEECRRMIAEVDKNGDGFVCFQDFARMMVLQR